MLPRPPGLPVRRTAEEVGHGTTTWFAAVTIAADQMNGLRQPRHRDQEFPRFLRQVARDCPEGELHPGYGVGGSTPRTWR